MKVSEASVGIQPLVIVQGGPPTWHTSSIGNNVDATLSAPADLSVAADGTVTVPINIDNADPAGSTGLIRGHLALTNDPKEFTVSAADVHPGSLLAGADWSIIPTIDQATGQIGITLSSNMPITSSLGGSLVTIDFHLVGQIFNPSSIQLVASASPNGQYVATELEDAQGAFTLSLAPAGSACWQHSTNQFFKTLARQPDNLGDAGLVNAPDSIPEVAGPWSPALFAPDIVNALPRQWFDAPSWIV